MNEIMTDKEVADLFHISVAALQRKMRVGFAMGETDLRKAAPEVICRRRWWYRPRVMALAAGKVVNTSIN